MDQLNADIIIGGNSENIGFGSSARSLTEAGYTFGGEITPTSTPDVTEQQLFFVAKTTGKYTNYGNLTVGSGEIAFIYKENEVWKKVSATFATTKQGELADSAYQKPDGGIPSTDMTEAVQTSLDKADTAIQSVTVGTTTTGEEGTDASVTNSGTPTNPVFDFKIPRGADGQNGQDGADGQDAVNPFKGWYPSAASLPANPVIGDYAYVKTVDGEDNPITKVYDCVTEGTWHDSGRTVDMSNVQTFETLQQVNQVSIVNDLTTGGSNDVLSAEQGKVLKQEVVQLDQEVTADMIASKDWRVSGNVTYDSNEIPISYNITWADDTAGTVAMSGFNDEVFEYSIITATYKDKTIVYTLSYDSNGYITNENINIQ